MIDPDFPVAAFHDYFAAAAASFERAVRRAKHTVNLQIGDQRWRVEQAGTETIPYLRAFSHLHLSLDDTHAPALTVCLWDYASTGEAPPMPAWTWMRQLPHSRESSFEDGRFFAAQYFNGFYLLLDWKARCALIWHPCWTDLPSWAIAAPLRELVELWFKPSTFIRLHAGAVGTKTGGVLFVGKSGSGKSTTSLACLQSGLGYVGDDYVLVDSARLTLYSLYSSGKLLPDNLVRLPQLNPATEPVADENGDIAGTGDKAVFFLDDTFGARLLTQVPLKAVFVLHLTHTPESSLESISPVRAIQALAPSTLLQADDPTPRDFQKIVQIAKALPCYRLNAGTDLAQLVAVIKDFLAHD